MDEKKQSNLILFWSHKPNKSNKHIYSQWYPSKFTDVKGIEYHCAEQYMMAQKAKLFGDKEIQQKIMDSEDPNEIKALGRKVKNFDEKLWLKSRYEIVKNATIYKFTQNAGLKKMLLESGDKEIIEASPYDRIWGIGFNENDAVKVDRSKWGLNLLGKAIMEVRMMLNQI